jgi:hypothetical protein
MVSIVVNYKFAHFRIYGRSIEPVRLIKDVVFYLQVYHVQCQWYRVSLTGVFMVNKMNNRLNQLYIKNNDILNEYSKKHSDKNLHGPLLLNISNYSSQKIKVDGCRARDVRLE